MAEFLTTKEISERIDKIIIGGAEKKIILMSPYVKMDTRIVESLSEALKNNKTLEVFVVYGKKKLPDTEKKKLENMNITVLYRPSLHAKCYMNEGAAILSSMNLHEYSQEKNDEFGIFIQKMSDDRRVYEKMEKEVQRIIDYSEKKDVSENKEKKTQKGYCIRCGKRILLDPTHPYCKECYTEWSKYKNPDYEEKYCHICGKETKTSINKPACKSCWTKYHNVLKFPSKK